MNGSQPSTIIHTTIAANEDLPLIHQPPFLTPRINVPARRELLADLQSEPNHSRHEYVEAKPESSRPCKNSRQPNTSRIDRVKIKTAAAAGLSTHEIIRKYGFTRPQIYYALRNSQNPKMGRCGRKPAISQEKAKELVSWIRREPDNRRVPYESIPDVAPELGLKGYGKKAIRTAIDSQGFGWRVSNRKGFSVADLIN